MHLFFARSRIHFDWKAMFPLMGAGLTAGACAVHPSRQVPQAGAEISPRQGRVPRSRRHLRSRGGGV